MKFSYSLYTVLLVSLAWCLIESADAQNSSSQDSASSSSRSSGSSSSSSSSTGPTVVAPPYVPPPKECGLLDAPPKGDSCVVIDYCKRYRDCLNYLLNANASKPLINPLQLNLIYSQCTEKYLQ